MPDHVAEFVLEIFDAEGGDLEKAARRLADMPPAGTVAQARRDLRIALAKRAKWAQEDE